MTKKRYFIVTLIRTETDLIVGGTTSEIEYAGVVLNRFIKASDIAALAKSRESERMFASVPVGTSFIEVLEADYNQFFEQEEDTAK